MILRTHKDKHTYSVKCQCSGLFHHKHNSVWRCSSTSGLKTIQWDRVCWRLHVCLCRCLLERTLLNFGAVLVFCCLSVSRPRSLHTPHSLTKHPPHPPILQPQLQALSSTLCWMGKWRVCVCLSSCVCVATAEIRTFHQQRLTLHLLSCYHSLCDWLIFTLAVWTVAMGSCCCCRCL